MCFLCVFLVWKRGEKLKIHPGKKQVARGVSFFFGLRGAWGLL